MRFADLAQQAGWRPSPINYALVVDRARGAVQVHHAGLADRTEVTTPDARGFPGNYASGHDRVGGSEDVTLICVGGERLAG